MSDSKHTWNNDADGPAGEAVFQCPSNSGATVTVKLRLGSFREFHALSEFILASEKWHCERAQSRLADDVVRFIKGRP
jgi:hypothetical protein